jgi:hypothetical protein
MVLTDDVERVLADIDHDDHDWFSATLRHGLLLFWLSAAQLIASGLGARPHHPINRHRLIPQLLIKKGEVTSYLVQNPRIVFAPLRRTGLVDFLHRETHANRMFSTPPSEDYQSSVSPLRLRFSAPKLKRKRGCAILD